MGPEIKNPKAGIRLILRVSLNLNKALGTIFKMHFTLTVFVLPQIERLTHSTGIMT